MIYRKEFTERLFDIFIVILMTVIAFVMIFPFWNGLVISLNDGVDANRGGIYFWPRIFSLANYQAVFKNSQLLWGFLISAGRTIGGTVLAVFFTSMVAFALSHQNLAARKIYMFIGIITMFFSGGLIPYYLVIRNLGLRNNFLVFIIPAMFNFYNMIIIMTFFRQLPGDLQESAKIDGAGYWRIFLQIILPLSMPIVATMGLFNAVYHWNDYFTAVLYIDNKKLLPIQTILYQIIAQTSSSTMISQIPLAAAQRRVTTDSIKMATMMIATFPILCVYPFLQKYFVKGMLIGSIKG